MLERNDSAKFTCAGLTDTTRGGQSDEFEGRSVRYLYLSNTYLSGSAITVFTDPPKTPASSLSFPLVVTS